MSELRNCSAMPVALRLSVGTDSRYTTDLWYVRRTQLFRRRTHTTTWERGTVCTAITVDGLYSIDIEHI